MVIVPFVSFRKGVPPGSTSNRLEAWSPPFQLRPFQSTDPIALTPTALPPRPTRAAGSRVVKRAKSILYIQKHQVDLLMKEELPTGVSVSY